MTQRNDRTSDEVADDEPVYKTSSKGRVEPYQPHGQGDNPDPYAPGGPKSGQVRPKR